MVWHFRQIVFLFKQDVKTILKRIFSGTVDTNWICNCVVLNENCYVTENF